MASRPSEGYRSIAHTLAVVRALALAATAAASTAACGTSSGPPGGGEACLCNGADASTHAGACTAAENDAGCATAIGAGPLPPPELG